MKFEIEIIVLATCTHISLIKIMSKVNLHTVKVHVINIHHPNTCVFTIINYQYLVNMFSACLDRLLRNLTVSSHEFSRNDTPNDTPDELWLKKI